MQTIVLAGERMRQVGIALPICFGIAIVEAREAIQFRPAISGKAAVRKRVSVRVADELSRLGVAYEVAFA